MIEDTNQSLPNLDVYGDVLPTPEEGLVEAKRLLARTFRRGDLAWLVGTRYDPVGPGWLIDIVRQGATGRWVRQRHMFDEAAQILHYRGESVLGDAEFRAARREGTIFPMAEWQDGTA
jgi:hypothetical protein